MNNFPDYSNLTELVLNRSEVKLVVSVNGEIQQVFAQEKPLSDLISIPKFIHKSLSDCTNLDLVKQILTSLSIVSNSLKPKSSFFSLTGAHLSARIFYEIVPLNANLFLLTLKQIQTQSIINELFVLQDIYELLSETNSLDQGIRLILNGLLRIEDLIGGGIFLFNSDQEIINEYVSGIPEGRISELFSLLKEPNIWSSLSQGNVVFKNKPEFLFSYWDESFREKIQSIAVFPILNFEILSGYLILFSSAPDFSMRTKENLEIISGKLSRSILRLIKHQSLKQEGQIFQDLIDESNELGFVITPVGKFIYCTPALQKRLGLTPDEVTSINIIKLIPETQLGNFSEFIKPGKRTYQNWEPVTLITKNGFPVNFQIHFKKLISDVQLVLIYGILKEDQAGKQPFSMDPTEQMMRMTSKIPIPVLIVNELSLNISFANLKAHQYFMYSEGEMVGKNLVDLISKTDNFPLLKLMRDKGISGLESDYAWSIISKENEVRKSRFIINRLDYENEKSFIIIIRDTDSEPQTMMIKEQSRKYQLDEKDLITCSLTPDGILKSVNQNYCSLVGKPEQKIIGRSFQENLFVSDYEEIFRHFYKLSPLNPVRKNICRIIDSSGETRWIEWTDQGIFEGEILVEIVSQGIDITESYHRELMQRSMEQRYQALVANLPIAIYVIHVKTNFYLYISPQMEQIFGYSAEELYLNPEKWNQTIYPDDVQYVQDYFQPESPQELYEPIEFRMYHKNGRLLWARLRGTKITLPDGTILFQGTVWDITEQRTSKEKLEYYYNFESLIIDISLKLMIANSENFSETINFIVKELGKFMQVDRSYIFDINYKNNTMSNTFEWCAEDVSSQIDSLQDIPLSRIPWLMERVNNNLDIVLDQVNELPVEASPEKEMLLVQGIKSLLVVPLIYNTKVMGLIGFDMVKKSTNWEQESINLLRLVSAMIISTLERFMNNN